MTSPTVSYRVEQQGERWHLFFTRADSSEYEWGETYDSDVTARYIGIQCCMGAPRTEDVVRARRRALRAG